MNIVAKLFVYHPKVSHSLVSFQYATFEYAKLETNSKGIAREICVTIITLNFSGLKVQMSVKIVNRLPIKKEFIATLFPAFSGLVS